MTFDKSKVYTALNAYELPIGSKCIFADTIQCLRKQVENDDVQRYVHVLTGIRDDSEMERFGKDDCIAYALAYLIKPPAKPKYKPFSNMENAVEVVKKHGGWIKRKKNNSLLFITGFTGGGIFLGNNYHYDFISLFREFIFVDDGSPCGELVEE